MVATRQSSNRNTSRDDTLKAYIDGMPTSNRRATRAQLARLVATKLYEEMHSLFEGNGGPPRTQLFPSFIRGTETGLHVPMQYGNGSFTVPYKYLDLPAGVAVTTLTTTYLRRGELYNDKHQYFHEIHGILALAGNVSAGYEYPHLMWFEISSGSGSKPKISRTIEFDDLVALMSPLADSTDVDPIVSPYTLMHDFWQLVERRAGDFQGMATLLVLRAGKGGEQMARLKGMAIVD